MQRFRCECKAIISRKRHRVDVYCKLLDAWIGRDDALVRQHSCGLCRGERDAVPLRQMAPPPPRFGGPVVAARQQDVAPVAEASRGDLFKCPTSALWGGCWIAAPSSIGQASRYGGAEMPMATTRPVGLVTQHDADTRPPPIIGAGAARSTCFGAFQSDGSKRTTELSSPKATKRRAATRAGS